MDKKNARIGVIVTVKDDVWQDFCLRDQRSDEHPPLQPISDAPTSGPYEGYVMLAYPFWWWKLEELEEL